MRGAGEGAGLSEVRRDVGDLWPGIRRGFALESESTRPPPPLVPASSSRSRRLAACRTAPLSEGEKGGRRTEGNGAMGGGGEWLLGEVVCGGRGRNSEDACHYGVIGRVSWQNIKKF